MPKGSLNLGRYFGIPVRAHWSIALVAVLFGVSLSGQFGVLAGILSIFAIFASILAHEFGHTLVARRYGVETQSIDLWALGGVARLDREPPSPRADGFIAAAGPLVSLAIGAVALGGGVLLSSGVIAGIGFVNLLLAVFNMLPGAPLDGGRVLRAVRWARTGNKYRAMREAGNAGRVLGWSLGLIGLGMMLYGLPGIFIAVTGVFIAVNARAEIAASYMAERLDGIKIRDLTWFGVAHAGGDMDADSMIWQRSRLGEAGAVAVDSNADGILDGVVLEDHLWAVPAELRALTMLDQLMVPFSQTAQVSPDDDLSAVLPRLNPLRPVVTVWTEGKLTGIVPPKALSAQLELARAAALGR